MPAMRGYATSYASSANSQIHRSRTQAIKTMQKPPNKSRNLSLRGELKLCKNQIRAVEKSRKHWRQVAEDAAKQAALLEEKLKNLE